MAVKQENFSELSGNWVKRAVDITDCLIGEGYNYLHYNVMQVQPPKAFPTAKIVLGLRVEVEERDRKKATENIQKAVREKEVSGAKYLGNYTYETNSDGTGPKKENRIDIPVTVGKNTRVIRIEVKPVKGGGSGGGSASTAINECMTAVYCAIRFHEINEDLDPNKGLDENLLKKAYDNYCTLDRPFKDLWADSFWHHSHCMIANKLKRSKETKDIKNPHFYRGGGFDDKEIKQAYKRLNDDLKAKKLPYFTAEDKWNPADIWMASPDFDIAPLRIEIDAGNINKFIAKNYTDKKLIGVSLKKLGPQANFKVVNDETPAQRKENIDSYQWINKNSIGGYDLYFENKGKTPIDVYLYYGSGTFDKFQLRNFGGDKDSWQIELKGATAAHGRCGGGNVAEIVNKYAPGSLPWNNTGLFNDCNPKGKKAKEITEEIARLLVEFKAKNVKAKEKIATLKEQTQYEDSISTKEQKWRYSKLNGLRLLKALEDNAGAKANKIVQSLYLFCSSQLDYSSVHVKIY